MGSDKKFKFDFEKFIKKINSLLNKENKITLQRSYLKK